MVGGAARVGTVSAGVHLVGGGWGGDARVWRAFVAEAAERAGGAPRIAVMSVRDGEEQLPAAERIRELVALGRPYAGYSAGSAIAASRALIGGWLAPGGHPVVDREVAEELDGLTVRDGLGLVPFSVDVHVHVRREAS